VKQIIRPGEVNWMTAGKGIADSERFEDPAALAVGSLEIIQTWVALPERDFVSSRKERIKQAKADWNEGRIVLPPNDNLEFVPLPEDKTRPAGSPPPQALS